MNILGKRYIFFGVSLLIIIPGLILLFAGKVPLSVDFTGGSLLEVSFVGKSPQPSDIIAVYTESNISDTQVQTTENGSYVIRSQFLENDQRDSILAALDDQIGEVNVIRFDSVGPSIGEQVTSRGSMAVAVSSILVVLFIAWSFRGIQNAFRYGICAILAMIHDSPSSSAPLHLAPCSSAGRSIPCS
jgi:preprotein translocase subunit SecF